MWRVKISQTGYEAFALQIGETAAGFYKLIVDGVLKNGPLPPSNLYAHVHFWNGEVHAVYFVKSRNDTLFLRLFDWLNDQRVRHVLHGSALLVWEEPPDQDGVSTRHVLTGLVSDTRQARVEAVTGVVALMRNTLGTGVNHIDWDL